MTLLNRVINFGRRGTYRLLRETRDVFKSPYRRTSNVELVESVAALRGEVAMLQDAVRNLRSELAGQISFLSHDIAEQINASAQRSLRGELADQLSLLSHDIAEQNKVPEAQFEERLNDLQSAAVDARNRLIHLDTSVHSRFNDILNVRFPGILEQLHEVSAFQLKVANQGSSRTELRDSERPRPIDVESFDAVLVRAQRDFPAVFAAWKERLDATREALAISETGNVANAADAYSILFRAFVNHYAAGAVLDVGCGPSGKPFYLSSYPSQLVSGIEPLATQQQGDIEVIRAISEYLPWPDRSFSTVISATSLDHCISLERSIDEMVRVLRQDGKILLWLGSNPGSPPYRPLDPNFTPADRFHLFHFDTTWFEPMLEARFSIVDRVKFDRAGYSHVFYCLSLVP